MGKLYFKDGTITDCDLHISEQRKTNRVFYINIKIDIDLSNFNKLKIFLYNKYDVIYKNLLYNIDMVNFYITEISTDPDDSNNIILDCSCDYYSFRISIEEQLRINRAEKLKRILYD